MAALIAPASVADLPPIRQLPTVQEWSEEISFNAVPATLFDPVGVTGVATVMTPALRVVVIGFIANDWIVGQSPYPKVADSPLVDRKLFDRGGEAEGQSDQQKQNPKQQSDPWTLHSCN
ncbi:MAG: hypothetical protein ACI9VS_002434 [Candidatus Binatia bacterium]